MMTEVQGLLVEQKAKWQNDCHEDDLLRSLLLPLHLTRGSLGNFNNIEVHIVVYR